MLLLVMAPFKPLEPAPPMITAWLLLLPMIPEPNCRNDPIWLLLLLKASVLPIVFMLCSVWKFDCEKAPPGYYYYY